MRLALLCLLAWPALAADGVQPYRWSVAAVTAANALDYHSTTVALGRPGLVEGHPWYRRDGGGFHGRRAAIAKASVILGNVLLQKRLVNSPRTRRYATVVNFAVAAGVGAVAVRNYRMQGR